MSGQTLEQQFRTPSDEFTPIPFWFWNDALTEGELIRQIGGFADKGVNGFVIHPRMGIPESIPYLSDRYMDLVETAVKEASRRRMTVFLYDEAMYPSGSAKGLVVEGNPEYASRGLKMTILDGTVRFELAELLEEGDTLVAALAVRVREGRVVGEQAIVALEPAGGAIDFEAPDGSGDWSIALFIETYSKGTIRGVHVGEDDGEPNAPAAADLLNPQAVAKFIRLTHDRYYGRLARYFGTTIQAVFTDEPDMLGRRHRKGLMPWTAGFLELFLAEGNRLTDLPKLWLEAETSAAVRARYRKAVRKRLVASYYKPLADWCEQHGIGLTGHPEASDDIGLLDHFHIPGQDVVWRWVGPEDGKALEGRHSTMAKCSSDAARHLGRRRNLNEALGVCGLGNGWHLTAGDMKWYLDWLFVRGVNMICPHAFYYSVDGPLRYKERPPDVGPNNIWWPHYERFAAYMKRMCWLMTDSRNVTRVAVLCRDNWLPWRIVKPLYENQLEFNYLEERLLSGVCSIGDGEIRIAGQSYAVLLVENEGVWDEATLEAVLRFRKSGGSVIVLEQEGVQSGEMPSTRKIAKAGQVVNALDGYIGRDVRLEQPCPDIRVSTVVKEGRHFIVLIHEGESRFEGTVTASFAGSVRRWDAWTGEIGAAELRPADSGTAIRIVLERRQSVIFEFDPSAAQLSESVPEPELPEQAASDVRPATTLALSEGWRVEAPGFPVAPAGLGAWNEQPELAFVSGTAVYTVSFRLDEAETDKPLLLDLGEVHEIAVVQVNGREAGVLLWAPYRVDIRPFVRRGANELRIAVTSSLANRYDRVGLPSGLIGPVRLLEG
ncbi:glycosylhydrolase-like jelly roll fold domain-containing protein [Paenibacillus ginsengarvi]|uniref:glycosylhydrolase-like jelly roll fold domain-containing protein n=1 Tax=Paenibacillus ginsengarvi TaxID=400777 RepID=UPI001F00E058|nr:glycosylhydrolase-like jelly roll fold domain-containing protein [Paenibacillus ginsengarvi]